MTVAIAEVGRRGRLDVDFASRNGVTVIRDSYCEAPFKITRVHPAAPSGIAHLIVMHTTAGLFGGDSLECSIHAGGGVRALVSQQSAAKIHPSGDRPAVQNTRIGVESGAELSIDWEPVIPFARSRLHQATTLEVAPGARLFYWEGLMAGRIGKGELWQFAELSSETRLEMHGQLLFLDRFLLNASPQHGVSDWMVKDTPYIGTGLFFGEEAATLAERLHEAIPDAGVDLPCANVIAVRVCASSGPDFHRAREAFRRISGMSRGFQLPDQPDQDHGAGKRNDNGSGDSPRR